jgi:hypothetical protein
MSKEDQRDNATSAFLQGLVKGVTVCMTIRSIFWTCLFLYVGYDQDTSNFCTQNIITLKTSTGHSESDPIADPSGMLGPHGRIVSWFRIIGIVQVVATVFNVGFFFRLAIGRVLAMVIKVRAVFQSTIVLAILMICDHIFQFVHMVLGFRLYLSGIPQECIDFKMGNNTAYTLLVYISISNIVLYSAVVFFICTAVLIGCCRMCHLGHTERISLLYHLVDSWRNSPESTGTQETSSKLSSTNPKTLGLFDKVKSPDTTQKGNAT